MALVDTARLIASLDLKGNFNAQIRASEKALGSFDAKLDKTQSRAYRVGQNIGTGIKRTATLAVAGTALFAGAMAKGVAAASDLSETVSKVGVVFGKQQAPVLALGKTAATSLGLSEQAAEEAAATYGNLFVSMGFAQKKSADMSVSLVKLAADLASFNNIDPTEALEKLRSGLTGEFEPLKTLGVNINDTILKAEALKLGLVKLEKGQKNYTAVLTPAQKAQAAYALIFEQTKTAQGDFARTSSGLANQTRILKANFTTLFTTLAKPVLPAVAKIFQAINKEVTANIPEVAKLGDAVAGLFTDENIKTGVDLFKSGIQTVKDAAPIIQGSAEATFQITKAAVGLFKSLPPELQKLAVGAFAVNKLTGGLFTTILGGLKDLVGRSRGSSPANPVYVSASGGGLGGVPVADKGGSLASKALSAASKVFIVGAAVGTFAELIGILQDQSRQNAQASSDQKEQVAQFTKVADKASLEKALQAINDQLNNTAITPETLAILFNVDGIRDTLHNERDQIVAALDRINGKIPSKATLSAASVAITGTRSEAAGIRMAVRDQITAIGTAGKEADDRAQANAVHLGEALNAQFDNMVRALRDARGDKAIKAVVEAALKVINSGRGGSSGAQNTVAQLRDALKRTHDPELQRQLRAAIAQVSAKIPGRQFRERELKTAQSILTSHRTTDKKISDLKAIERDLKDHGMPNAAETVRKKIAALQNAQTAAQHATTQAVKDKDLSVHNTVNVNVPVNINARKVADAIASYDTFYGKRRD